MPLLQRTTSYGVQVQSPAPTETRTYAPCVCCSVFVLVVLVVVFLLWHVGLVCTHQQQAVSLVGLYGWGGGCCRLV